MKWEDKAEAAFSGTSLAVRCYESHPVLKLGKGKLHGGAARHPVKGADVYVVLQDGDMNGKQSDPWEKQTVTEVAYFIRDMHAPADVKRFKKLVTWLCTQLQDGKTVHVGCIGGHGRTGTVLSAVIAEATGEKDAIGWVRKHYCKKAVESREQVEFLVKHYGVTKAAATKSFDAPKSNGKDAGFLSSWKSDAWTSQPQQMPLVKASKESAPVLGKVRRVVPEGLTKATKSFGPMASKRSLWNARKRKA